MKAEVSLTDDVGDFYEDLIRQTRSLKFGRLGQFQDGWNSMPWLTRSIGLISSRAPHPLCQREFCRGAKEIEQGL
jgi:hypothetical protein